MRAERVAAALWGLAAGLSMNACGAILGVDDVGYRTGTPDAPSPDGTSSDAFVSEGGPETDAPAAPDATHADAPPLDATQLDAIAPDAGTGCAAQSPAPYVCVDFDEGVGTGFKLGKSIALAKVQTLGTTTKTIPSTVSPPYAMETSVLPQVTGGSSAGYQVTFTDAYAHYHLRVQLQYSDYTLPVANGASHALVQIVLTPKQAVTRVVFARLRTRSLPTPRHPGSSRCIARAPAATPRTSNCRRGERDGDRWTST